VVLGAFQLFDPQQDDVAQHTSRLLLGLSHGLMSGQNRVLRHFG
jgi:hypothetical protein